MKPEDQYIFVARRSWYKCAFTERVEKLPGKWRIISKKDDLNAELLEELRPKFVFVSDWQWKIPQNLLDLATFVCFHSTDVPFGRGGSPIQNLIARGCRETMLTALKMTAEFDAGPVYMKRRVSLEGGGEEVFLRIARMIPDMIETIITANPEPQPQQGEPVVFYRRKAKQSELPTGNDELLPIFDHIRMLDAGEYPRAFLEAGNLRLEFSHPVLRTGCIDAHVRITIKNTGGETPS